MSAPSESHPEAGDALVVVDVQNDFLPGGSLAVPAGDAVVAPLNAWLRRFAAAGLPIFATRDWHPPGHCSFRERGGPWPPHCVAGSMGARFPRELELPASAHIVSKGGERDADAYSGFSGTDLDGQLRRAGVRRLFVGGLAADYCVLQTVKDALSLGYAVVVLPEAVRAVEVRPGDGARAIAPWRPPARTSEPAHDLGAAHRLLPADHAAGVLRRRHERHGGVRVLLAQAAAAA